MNNRYESMRLLRNSLDELFGLCGIQTRPVDIRQAPGLIRLAEKLVRDEGLCSFLRELDIQAGQALQEMKERQLDVWNIEQNEIHMQELEQELQEQSQKLRETEQELAVERQKKQEAERELAAQRQKKQEIERELSEERQKTQEALEERPKTQEAEQELTAEHQKAAESTGEGNRQSAEAEAQQAQVKLIKDIISVRDKLLLQKSWMEEQAPEEEIARKVLDGQLRETARCLRGAGVEILEESGSFDTGRHTVVETRPAEHPEQVDQIAETFRPGYCFQGEILRPQEVILFA